MRFVDDIVGGGGGYSTERLGMLCNDIAVELFASAAEELEEDDEEDNSDTTSGKHALGGDVP